MGKALKDRIEEWKNDSEGLQSWLDNPYWAGYYNDAPSGACKAVVALEFYYSDTEDDEVVDLMKLSEEKLSLEDLEHLAKYAGNTPRKGQLMKRIEELKSAS